MNLLLSLILFFNFAAFSKEVPVQITINEMRCLDGVISVSVFQDQAGFASEKAMLHKVFPKKQFIKDGLFSCSIDLPKGKYGIVILDDENTDGEMNYNFMGIPKEGYGFSDFSHRGFSKPSYSDFEFQLEDEPIEMNIILRYF